MYDPAVPEPASSLTPVDRNDKEDEGHDTANGPVDGIEGSLGEIDKCEGECESDVSSNATSSKVIDECEGECESDLSSSAMSSEVPPSESEQFEAAEAAGRAMANSHDDARQNSNHGE